MRLLALALLPCSVAFAGPIATVWPQQLKRLPDGTLEYSYDLTAVKRGLTADAVAAHGEEKVKAYLAALPPRAAVQVKGRPKLQLSGAKALERAPLATSFASVPGTAMLSEDPLEVAGAKARAATALHPDEPKLLPSAEMVLWRVRELEAGVLAALELDSDRLRRELLSRLLTQLKPRLASASGDVLEGTRLLVARLSVAQSCLDPGKLSAEDPAVQLEALATLERFSADPELMTPTGFFTWSPALQCAFRRARVLEQPFAPTRGGYAAPLVLQARLDADAQLKRDWQKLVGRRNAVAGGPTQEPLTAYVGLAKRSASASLEDLGAFIDALGPHPDAPPGVFGPEKSPMSTFLQSLEGAERALAGDELWNAAQDGRLHFDGASVGDAREAVLGTLATVDAQPLVRVDARWRDRLNVAFCALAAAHHEPVDRSAEPSEDDGERGELIVRLQVPPAIEVEPLAQSFAAAATSLERLSTVLANEHLSAISALSPEGASPATPAGPQLVSWAAVARGLAALTGADAALANGPAAQAARAWLSGWRQKVALDVRAQLPGLVSAGGQRAHVVIAGVGRRELSVTFLEAPTVEVVGAVKGVRPNTRAEQRYIVPVLVTAQTVLPAAALPRKPAEVRALVDKANRSIGEVQGALTADAP